MSEARCATTAVRVSIPVDRLETARACDINSSVSPENRLRQHVQEKWLTQNAEGIEEYNRDVAEHGGFGDTLRSF